MEDLVPEIRLKSGCINYENGLKLTFIFGLVFEKNGNYIFELHFDENAKLEEIFDNNEKTFSSLNCELFSRTIDNHSFYAKNIYLKTFPFRKSMAIYHCNGFIKLEEEKWDGYERNEEEKSDEVHFVVLEGLRMKFDEHSVYLPDDHFKSKKELFERKGNWDFTTISFTHSEMEFQFFLYDHSDSNRVVLEFVHPKDQYQCMSYSIWKNIKFDFINFLSFCNGAKVFIREEHYGDYYKPHQLLAEKSIYYSEETNLPRSWNSFMGLNNVWYRSENVLKKAFMFNFHKYQNLNEQWDLNSVIFYLNSSQQNKSIGDKIFIQTILLERLSNKYAEKINEDRVEILSKETFEVAKNELLDVLKKYKKEISKTKFHTLRSRLSQINSSPKKANDIKFKNLIEGVGILVSEKLETLLAKRNKIIHEGEIGNFEEAIDDYFLMDKLIRTIIIKIIGYEGPTIEDGLHYNVPPERDIEFITE